MLPTSSRSSSSSSSSHSHSHSHCTTTTPSSNTGSRHRRSLSQSATTALSAGLKSRFLRRNSSQLSPATPKRNSTASTPLSLPEPIAPPAPCVLPPLPEIPALADMIPPGAQHPAALAPASPSSRSSGTLGTPGIPDPPGPPGNQHPVALTPGSTGRSLDHPSALVPNRDSAEHAPASQKQQQTSSESRRTKSQSMIHTLMSGGVANPLTSATKGPDQQEQLEEITEPAAQATRPRTSTPDMALGSSSDSLGTSTLPRSRSDSPDPKAPTNPIPPLLRCAHGSATTLSHLLDPPDTNSPSGGVSQPQTISASHGVNTSPLLSRAHSPCSPLVTPGSATAQLSRSRPAALHLPAIEPGQSFVDMNSSSIDYFSSASATGSTPTASATPLAPAKESQSTGDEVEPIWMRLSYGISSDNSVLSTPLNHSRHTSLLRRPNGEPQAKIQRSQSVPMVLLDHEHRPSDQSGSGSGSGSGAPEEPPTSESNDSFADQTVAARVPSKALVSRRMKLYAALIEIANTERRYSDDLGLLVLIFFENLTRCTYFAPPTLVPTLPRRESAANPPLNEVAVDTKLQAQQQLYQQQEAEQRWKLTSVMRNAQAILRLHQLLSAKLDKVLMDHNLLTQGTHRRAHSASLCSVASASNDSYETGMHRSLPVIAMNPALDQAVIDIAHELVKIAPRLAIYKHYCSRHAEALELIHEAERYTSDWAAYEAACSDMIRWQSEAVDKSAAVAEKRRAQSQTQAPHAGMNVDASDSTPNAVSPPETRRSGSESSTSLPPPPTTALTPSGKSNEGSEQGLKQDGSLSPTSPATSLGPSTMSSHATSVGATMTASTSQSTGGTGVSSNTTTGATNARRAPLLRFHDFFVKPIQRIMLYRLMLTTVRMQVVGLPESSNSRQPMLDALDEALVAVSRSAEQVDEAGKERERELLAEMVSLRTLPHSQLPGSLLRRLGPVVLAGPLQVYYHHYYLAPAEVPVRFKYLSLVLYHDLLLLVKVRKNGAYEVRHFSPLLGASVTTWPYMNDPLLLSRSSICLRLTLAGEHHLELAAVNERERDLWLVTLEQQIKLAHDPDVPSLTRLQRGEHLPTSFPVASSGATIPAEERPAPDLTQRSSSPKPVKRSAMTPHTGMLKADPLVSVFAQALGPDTTLYSQPSTDLLAANPSLLLPSYSPVSGSINLNSSPVDALIKAPSSAQCASADKHMMMSATCVAVHHRGASPGGGTSGSTGASTGSRVHWGVSSPAQLLLRASSSALTPHEKDVEGPLDKRRRFSSTPLMPNTLSMSMGVGGAMSGSGSAVVAAARTHRRKSIGEYTLMTQANPTKRIRVLDIASTSADALPSPGAANSEEQPQHSASIPPGWGLGRTDSSADTARPFHTGSSHSCSSQTARPAPGEQPLPPPGNSLHLDSWRLPFRRKHAPMPNAPAGMGSVPRAQPTTSVTFPSSDDPLDAGGTTTTEAREKHPPPSSSTGSAAANLLFKHKRRTSASFNVLSSFAQTATSPLKEVKDKHHDAKQLEHKGLGESVPHLVGRKSKSLSVSTTSHAPRPDSPISNNNKPNRAAKLLATFHSRDRDRHSSPSQAAPAKHNGEFVHARGYKVTPSPANDLVEPDHTLRGSPDLS